MQTEAVKYIVRIPGHTSWSEHTTAKAALREREKANRIAPYHRVYAEYGDGRIEAISNSE